MTFDKVTSANVGASSVKRMATGKNTFWVPPHIVTHSLKTTTEDSAIIPFHPNIVLSGDERFALELHCRFPDGNSGSCLASVHYNAAYEEVGVEGSTHRGVDIWNQGDGQIATHIINTWSDDALKVANDLDDPNHINVFDGGWHWIKIVYDGSMHWEGVSISIDDVEQQTVNTISDEYVGLVNPTVHAEGLPTRIGGRNNNDGDMHQPCPGHYSGLRIWRGGILLGYWPLNEGQGSTIYDHSGNGNNGSVLGATWHIE